MHGTSQMPNLFSMNRVWIEQNENRKFNQYKLKHSGLRGIETD